MPRKKKEDITCKGTCNCEHCDCNPCTCADLEECEEIRYHETAQCDSEVEELKQKLLRTSAELVNYRRRKDEETSNLLKYQHEGIAEALLPIVDDFERAISLDDDNLDDELSKFLVGFKMIFGNLANLLEKYEIREIKALHESFNPNYHHAVLTENNPGRADNQIVDVMQKGYMYKDKVLRPAMVRVNKIEKEKEKEKENEENE